MSNFIAPTGYVDLDNDCQYSIDRKSTRSRESIDPSDVAFYFNTYLAPKYGLDNININNVASFMKDLEMNWTKLTPDMKDKVMNIMVDNILPSGDYDFRNALLTKLNIPTGAPVASTPVASIGKSSFGGSDIMSWIKNNLFVSISIAIVIVLVVMKFYSK